MWTRFLTVLASGTWWNIISGPAPGVSLAGTTATTVDAPSPTTRPRTDAQNPARVAASVQSMLTPRNVVFMVCAPADGVVVRSDGGASAVGGEGGAGDVARSGGGEERDEL